MSIPIVSCYTSCCPQPVGKLRSREPTCPLFSFFSPTLRKSILRSHDSMAFWTQGAGRGRQSTCACLWVPRLWTWVSWEVWKILILNVSITVPACPQSHSGQSHWPKDRANHHQLDDEVLHSSIGKVLYLGEKDYLKNFYVYSKKSNQWKRIGNKQVSSSLPQTPPDPDLLSLLPRSNPHQQFLAYLYYGCCNKWLQT